MHTTNRSRRVQAVAALCAFGLLAVACGDDDDTDAAADDTTTTSAPAADEAGGEFAEYCEATAELDSQESAPTAEQMQHIKEVRPDEIGEDVDFVADAIIAAEGDFGKVFGDPEVEERLGAIEAWEGENCEGGDGEDEGDEEQATEPLEGAQVVEVTAVDFAFQGIPETVPAGDVSFSFTNGGEAAHEMFVARLGEGVELDDLLAMEDEPSEDQAKEIGGVFGAPGDETVYLNAEGLEPGTYAVVCFIPGPEGKSHHELGMKTTFTVS